MYHVIYRSDSFFSTHANLFTIVSDIWFAETYEWAGMCLVWTSSHALDDDVVRDPVIYTWIIWLSVSSRSSAWK